MLTTTEFKDKLVLEISKCEKVKGIGQTGDINAKLIPGQSDIDLFILCSAIPSEKERLLIYSNLASNYSECTMSVCNGGLWGYGDILVSNNIEVMPMYFTIEEMERYIVDTLNGKNINKAGRFYPTGRLASVETINILYEETSEWTKLKEKVQEYPKSLFKALYSQNISCILDEEDLGRVLLRKEILFYHQVLEEALDHFLRALYAVNHSYFPSRKRIHLFIEYFQLKPQNCYTRLHQIIIDSTNSETIENSVRELKAIVAELKELGRVYL